MGRTRATQVKKSTRRSQQGSGSGTEVGFLLKRIRQSLSLDLRHRNYPVSEEEYYWACLNHCYVATEALYYLFGRAAGYAPYLYKHPDGSTHWWLYNAENECVLDPTEPQLNGKPFPYKDGRRAVFLTQKPSKRAAELIRRVKARRK